MHQPRPRLNKHARAGTGWVWWPRESAQISCAAIQCAMASQPVYSPSLRLSTAEFDFYIRGYHVYQVVWTPVVGEMLLLKQEPTNTMDVSAVAVCKENEIVGHVPFNISSLISQFLRRDCNKGFAEVMLLLTMFLV